MRTSYDLEMMREVGFCSGIENYSRHIDGRGPGTAPYTLLDYFPDDYLVVIDESHVTVPQLHGMYEGDLSRKSTLVEHGFRLPSAIDNRPLRFDEFTERVNQVVFMSATPGDYELRRVEADRRADRPAHRADRSRGPDPADEGPGRRPDRGDPQARRERPARPGDHAHQEDGRGPHRLPRRDGDPRAIPALRGRHAAADRDPARPAAGGVRRPGRHQPAARGTRPPGGLARRDPRRRQGGLPALRDVADPDDRPRGAQRGRHGADVRGPHHRLHEVGDQRDPAAPADPAPVQHRERHRPADDPSSRLRHPAVARRRHHHRDAEEGAPQAPGAPEMPPRSWSA